MMWENETYGDHCPFTVVEGYVLTHTDKDSESVKVKDLNLERLYFARKMHARVF